jgi:hypothetical protein
VDTKYNLSLAEAGEREIVRVLQQCVQRQAHTDALNKQLFHERSNYQVEKRVMLETTHVSRRRKPIDTFRQRSTMRWH